MDAEFISERGAAVITSDISLGAARRAAERSRIHNVSFISVVASADRLPFRDGSIDLVYVHDGLHHLDEPFAAIDEMARVAGQWVAITEPARASVTKLAVRFGLALDREPAGNRVIRLDPGEVIRRLRSDGFSVLAATRYAMYYRHRPGKIVAWLSSPWILPAVTRVYRALDHVLGRAGNKMTVAVERSKQAAGGSDANQ
jgi:SAM-dependent methyltransferase